MNQESVKCKDKCRKAQKTNGVPCDECYSCYVKQLERVETVNDALGLAISSIKGDIPLWTQFQSPSHCYITNFSSGDIVSIDKATQYFIDMNRLRFLTTDSQMGNLDYKKPITHIDIWEELVKEGFIGSKLYPEFEKRLGKLGIKKIYHKREPSEAQRSYVTGFIEKNRAKELISELRSLGFWAFIPRKNAKKKDIIPKGSDAHSLTGLRPSKSNNYITVTWDWGDPYTSIPIKEPDIDVIELTFPNIVDEINNDYYFVALIDPVIGRLGTDKEGLFTGILKSLSKSKF